MSSSPSLGNPARDGAVPSLSSPYGVPSAGHRANPDESAKKAAGYGLPCAKCRTYYPADLKTCPVCKNSERVDASVVVERAAPAPAEAPPDPDVLEQERERFLREFKAQLASSQELGESIPAARCTLAENHPNESPSAVICAECYEQLQERVDVLEAALHMDLKEAAQIVYDAVWADASDPSKTYENAAHALLSELRKRSGVILTFTNLQPSWQDPPKNSH